MCGWVFGDVLSGLMLAASCRLPPSHSILIIITMLNRTAAWGAFAALYHYRFRNENTRLTLLCVRTLSYYAANACLIRLLFNITRRVLNSILRGWWCILSATVRGYTGERAGNTYKSHFK